MSDVAEKLREAGKTREHVVDGVAYILPRSERGPSFVRKVGSSFAVGLCFRWTSWGIGFDILHAGLLVAIGPAFFWIAHIERQLASYEAGNV